MNWGADLTDGVPEGINCLVMILADGFLGPDFDFKLKGFQAVGVDHGS
jgi:hypothetical protein